MATTMMEMPKMDYVDQNAENVQRVAVMTEPFRMELRWAQIPVPAPDEVLVKVKYVGICGNAGPVCILKCIYLKTLAN